MSNRRRIQESENIYSSACIQALEQEYCSSCSAAVVSSACVSSHGLGARIMSRIYHGGRQAVYTATMGAMLANNMAMPLYGATIVVSSGVTSSNLSAGNGTEIDVYGTTVSTRAGSGGQEIIYNGGVANGTLISGYRSVYSSGGYVYYGGSQFINSGGVANSTNIYRDGLQIINDGGVANSTTIKSYSGYQYISSGGVANNTTLTGGGSQIIYNGGVANSTTISVGSQIINDGGVANSTTMSGGTQYINSGGTANSTTIHSGHQYISSGGVASRVVIASGGSQIISSGGVASNVTGVLANMQLETGGSAVNISQGLYDNVNVTVTGGDTTYVIGTNANGFDLSLSNGVASGFVVNNGGTHNVSAGGSSVDLVQSVGGNVNVVVDKTDGTYVSGRTSGNKDLFLSNGVASNFIVYSGGTHTINAGGSSLDVVQKVSGNVNVTFGGADGTTITGSNALGSFSLSNGVASNFIVYANGEQQLLDGAIANNTILSGSAVTSGTSTYYYGGNQIINSGGVANSTVVSMWGSQIISDGGVANSTTMSGGGQYISSGGVANSTTMSGGGQYISSGGVANSTTMSRGYQYISSGGVANDTILLKGSAGFASQIILSGGIASNTIISSGRVYVSSGGSAINVSQLSAGYGVYASALSGDSATLITGTNASGSFFMSNGSAQNWVGGSLYVGSGAVVNSAYNTSMNVAAGGSAVNVSGGLITHTVGAGDGTYIQGSNANGAFLLSGGVASNFIVSSGTQNISSGGVANKTTISTYGYQYIRSGGVANSTTIKSYSGYQYISSGGVANNTTLTGGGNQIIYNGGVTNSTTINNSGRQYISSGGVASNTYVASNGSQIISSAGIADHTTLVSGAKQTINPGGSSINAVLNEGAMINMTVVSGDDKTMMTGSNVGGANFYYSSGVASGFVVSNGGYHNVSNGGSSYLIDQKSGGQVNVVVDKTDGTIVSGTNESGAFSLSGGVASNFIVYGFNYNQDSLHIINSGGSSLNLTQNDYGRVIISHVISAGDTTYVTGTHRGSAMLVSNGVVSNLGINLTSMFLGEGATAIDVELGSYGYLYLSSGATASNTRLFTSGKEYIFNGAITNNTLINGYEAYQSISSGGVANSTVINSGSQFINSGGVANNTIVNFSGTPGYYNNAVQYVTSGGVANSTVVNGGSQVVYNGGSANKVVLSGSGTTIVSNGGRATDVTLSSGGKLVVSAGGQGIDVVQHSGGIVGADIVSGSGTWLTGINQDGSAFRVEDGVGYDFIVSSGGTLRAYDGGVASRTQVTGGELFLSNGGANETYVTQGGKITTISGTTTSTVITSGNQLVSTYGYGLGTLLSGSGASQILIDGTGNDTILRDGAVQYVSGGGVANNAQVSSGTQNVYSMGIASGGVFYASGVQNIAAGGKAISANLLSGANANVLSGGSADYTQVSGGADLNIAKGASATHITQISGGNINVDIDGTDTLTYVGGINQLGGAMLLQSGVGSNFVINSDRVQNVISGGIANDTVVLGGVQNVVNARTNSTLVAGGAQVIGAAGRASATTLNSGAVQQVQSGGFAYNAVVNESSLQDVQSGGYAGGAIISGGLQNVSSGAAAVGTTLSNGAMNIYQGATVNGVSANGGMLNIHGDNTLQGTINLTSAAVNINHVSAMNTLTMSNLGADNALFNMSVDLSSQTGDKLSITNSYTGNANLQLTNVASGAIGAVVAADPIEGDGIKLVEFGSGAAVSGTFDLVGGQWDEGGYVYKLQQGTTAGVGKDYYLRAISEYTDTFKTMLNIPVMNVMLARTGMNSLQKRLGDLQNMDNTSKKQGIWARTYYKDMRINDLVKTDMNLFGAEAGYDWLFMADEPTKLYAGVLLGYIDATDIKTETRNGVYEKGKGTSPSIGIYATLVNDERWFVDIAARNFWTKLDMSNHASDGTKLDYTPKRNVLTASVEGGKTFMHELSRDRFLRIEPKAELNFMNASADKAEVKNGVGSLEYKSTNYLNIKGGVLLGYNVKRSNGLLLEPLIEVAYRQELLGKGDVSYGGATEKANMSGGNVEANIGLNMQLTENLYWYGLGSYEAGSKVKGWGVYAGIRYTFGDDGAQVKKPTKAKQKKVKQAAKQVKKQTNTTKVTASSLRAGEVQEDIRTKLAQEQAAAAEKARAQAEAKQKAEQERIAQEQAKAQVKQKAEQKKLAQEQAKAEEKARLAAQEQKKKKKVTASALAGTKQEKLAQAEAKAREQEEKAKTRALAAQEAKQKAEQEKLAQEQAKAEAKQKAEQEKLARAEEKAREQEAKARAKAEAKAKQEAEKTATKQEVQRSNKQRIVGAQDRDYALLEQAQKQWWK